MSARALLSCLLVLGCSPSSTPAETFEAEAPQAPSMPEAPMEAAAAPPSIADMLRDDVEALEALLDGRLPEVDAPVDPRTLFEIDPLDEESVRGRRASLAQTLGAETVDEEASDAGVPDVEISDAEVSDAEVSDAEVSDAEGSDAEVSEVSDAGALDGPASDAASRDAAAEVVDVTVGPDAGIGGADAGAADDASVGATGTAGAVEPSADPGEALRTLRQRRDALRLRFLRLPSTERAELLEAVDEALELSRASDSAAAARDEAEDEEAAALAARAEAEDEARNARESGVRDRAEARAVLHAYRADLADRTARAAEQRQEELALEAERLEMEQHVRAELRDDTEAEALYDALVDVLVDARQELHASLGRTIDVPSPPRTDQVDPDELDAALQAREEALAAIDALHWEHLDALAEELHEGNELRLELLDAVGASRRRSLRGFGSAGRAQLLRELDQVGVMAHYGGLRTFTHVSAAPSALWSAASDPTTRGRVGTLLILLILGIGGWRRRESILDGIEERLWQRVSTPRGRARIVPWWRRIESILPALWLAGVAIVLAEVADPLHESHVGALARNVVLVVAVYGGFVAIVGGELTAWQRVGRAGVREVMRDVRFAGRWALGSALLMLAAAWVVGRGTLFAYLSRVVVFVAIVVAIVLVHRWRDAIVRAYRERHPEGRLVGTLDGDPGLRRFLAVLLASVQVGVETGIDSGRGLLVRFAAGRKAVALLKRRRVEAESSEEVPIPTDLVEAFSLTPVAPQKALPHFPEIEEVAGVLRDGGAAIALVGEVGTGKTSWLRALKIRLPGDVWALGAPPGADDPHALCRFLAEALGLPEVDDADGLRSAIEEADLRGVVLLDDVQNLFLRKVGGTDGFHALAEVVGSTQSRIAWVCAVGESAWRYLMSTHAGESVFTRIVRLKGWSPEEVERLIDHRMRRPAYSATFEDLLEGAPEGAARHRAIVRSRDEYFRLLADYTEGNPRLVLHFWLRSLRIDGDEVRVRLFATPEPTRLDELHDQGRFALAAIVLHEDLDAQETAAVLRLSPGRAGALLATLQARGILERDSLGRYHVTAQWHRAVVRHLRRRRLLPT